jgi:hypothetical protein
LGKKIMKTLTIASALAAQLLAVARPAMAAELAETRNEQMGAFGGVRVRVPLDGHAGEQGVRAGLTLAPTLHSRDVRGHSRMRIGEGLELGLNGDDRVRLSLAGTPVSRLVQGPAGPDGRRAGISPIGWVAIGVGVAAVAAATWFVIAINDDDRCCE